MLFRICSFVGKERLLTQSPGVCRFVKKDELEAYMQAQHTQGPAATAATAEPFQPGTIFDDGSDNELFQYGF